MVYLRMHTTTPRPEDGPTNLLALRILRRGLPVAAVAGVFGLLVAQAYRVVELFGAHAVLNDRANWTTPAVFAAFGFLTIAALECVRKKEKPKAGVTAAGPAESRPV
jgi:hypothetical protein